MANLKAIRDRIQSVKNTQKITEAMRLVAAARVRRAQEQVTATRPFADRLAQVLYNLQGRLQFEDVDLQLSICRKFIGIPGYREDQSLLYALDLWKVTMLTTYCSPTLRSPHSSHAVQRYQ